MTTYFPTSTALYTERVDVGQAEHAWSARNNLRDCNFCVHPDGFNYDHYGRVAHPHTLDKRQGGQCNNYDNINNVAAFIQRENNLERPWLNPVIRRTPYDTLGKGRGFQTAEAGCCGDGAWPMHPGALVAAEQQCCDIPEPRIPKRKKCFPGSSLYSVQYRG